MTSHGPAGILGAFETSIVLLAWLGFALAFVAHARSLRGIARVRERRSLIGLLLQIAGYILVRVGLRAAAAFGPLGTVVAVLAALVLVASVLVVWAAVRALGRQWSLAAQPVEGHELVTEGIYGVVRHPICTAMLGMLLGSALAVSSWWALVGGTAVFLVGTRLRIAVEERLLTGEFGDAYRDHARRVPALLPRWPRRATAETLGGIGQWCVRRACPSTVRGRVGTVRVQ